jgi:cell division protein FtsA
MNDRKIHAGLDVGGSKVRAAVAEVCDDGGLRLLGVGEAKYGAERKLGFPDIEQRSQSIREALALAEGESGIKIGSIRLATIGKKPGERHEAGFHFAHGEQDHFEQTIQALKQARTGLPEIEIEDVVASSLASAHAVLDQSQKEAGAVVIDLGARFTDYILYLDGVVRCSGVLAVGGQHFTNDLAIGLRIPLELAEKLKIEEGEAEIGKSMPGEKIVLEAGPGFSGREVERQMVNLILHARLEAMFPELRQRLGAAFPFVGNDARILLTGGCSKMRGIAAVAESIFQTPAQLGTSQGISGPPSVLENPRWSTCLGLLKGDSLSSGY